MERPTDSSKSNGDEAQTKRNLDAMLKQAEKSLQLGVDGLRKQEGVDERAVLAALSLAQLEVNSGHRRQGGGTVGRYENWPTDFAEGQSTGGTSGRRASRDL